jgi:hypothetical protein
MESSLKTVIATLSRALGNDLVSYSNPEEDMYTLRLWPPIEKSLASTVKATIKYYIPSARVKVSRKKGIIEIRL